MAALRDIVQRGIKLVSAKAKNAAAFFTDPTPSNNYLPSALEIAEAAPASTGYNWNLLEEIGVRPDVRNYFHNSLNFKDQRTILDALSSKGSFDISDVEAVETFVTGMGPGLGYEKMEINNPITKKRSAASKLLLPAAILAGGLNSVFGNSGSGDTVINGTVTNGDGNGVGSHPISLLGLDGGDINLTTNHAGFYETVITATSIGNIPTGAVPVEILGQYNDITNPHTLILNYAGGDGRPLQIRGFNIRGQQLFEKAGGLNNSIAPGVIIYEIKHPGSEKPVHGKLVTTSRITNVELRNVRTIFPGVEHGLTTNDNWNIIIPAEGEYAGLDTTVTVSPGLINTFDLRLKRTYDINTVITDSTTGEPVQGVPVELRNPATEEVYCVGTTDSSGVFSHPLAFYPNQSNIEFGVLPVHGYNGAEVVEVVPSGTSQFGISIAKPLNPMTIRPRNLLVDGEPVISTPLDINLRNMDTGEVFSETLTGEGTINLPPGTYDIKITDPSGNFYNDLGIVRNRGESANIAQRSVGDTVAAVPLLNPSSLDYHLVAKTDTTLTAPNAGTYDLLEILAESNQARWKNGPDDHIRVLLDTTQIYNLGQAGGGLLQEGTVDSTLKIIEAALGGISNGPSYSIGFSSTATDSFDVDGYLVVFWDHVLGPSHGETINHSTGIISRANVALRDDGSTSIGTKFEEISQAMGATRDAYGVIGWARFAYSPNSNPDAVGKMSHFGTKFFKVAYNFDTNTNFN